MTSREQRFIQEYLVDWNATRAYRRAGYQATPAAARANASRLLAKANIRAAIEAAQHHLAERTGVRAERTLLELARVAFACLTDVVTWGPEGMTVKASETLDAHDQAAVYQVEMTETVRTTGNGTVTTRRVRVRMQDKLPALIQLGKHLGLFKAKVEVGMSDQLRELLATLDQASAEVFPVAGQALPPRDLTRGAWGPAEGDHDAGG